MVENSKEKKIPTNWYVITGGPGSGKTTTVDLLRARGYETTIEHARHYIDTMRVQGKSIQDIRKNQLEFQLAVLKMQIAEERSHAASDILFLDRAIPDALAYYRYLNLPPDPLLTDALLTASYKKIFVLDPLPMVNDYARTEDELAQHRIHQLIIQVYTELGFTLVHVPVAPAEQRVDFIIQNL